MQDSRALLLATDFPALRRDALTTLQVNLGYRCNQSCAHCHVNAGPGRTEEMDAETVDLVLAFARQRGVQTLDLTGGAPELNPHFRHLVRRARALGLEVVDRCNLTILLEPGFEDLAQFLSAQGVTVTASLPCYNPENVNQQRGRGVFDASIEALRRLNALGYGSGDPERVLNLVYNPVGATLPPAQEQLEETYRRELGERFGVVFDHLFTLTNMPISRFGAVLLAQGQFESYMALLRDAFSSANLQTVMCRSLLSIDWRGYVYDCDFNQMLDLPSGVGAGSGNAVHLGDLLEAELMGHPIRVGAHCYGCTAGQGSSCGGALSG